MRKYIFIILIFLFSFTEPLWADDISIYTTSVTPNILIIEDNSNSFDEDFSGNAVGSYSPSSKSVVGRNALISIVKEFADRFRFGLMTFQLQPGGVYYYYIHNSPYFASYDPRSYCPNPPPDCVTYAQDTTQTVARSNCQSACQASNSLFNVDYFDEILIPRGNQYGPLVYPKVQRMVNPTDPSNFVYYKHAYPMYASFNAGTAFCYAPGYNTNTIPDKGYSSYNYDCYFTKTGTADGYNMYAVPLIPPQPEAAYGYSNPYFSGPFGPTDSDYANGYDNFGRRLAWKYVGPTWFSDSSPGGGYLQVPVGNLSDGNGHPTATYNNLLSKLNPNENNQSGYMSCQTGDMNTCPYVINAGLTPTAGTFQAAINYFMGVSGYTSPIQASCQQNFIIFVTDGLPDVDENGNPGTTASLLPAVLAKIDALRNITVGSNNFNILTYVLGVGSDITNTGPLGQMAVHGGTAVNGLSYYASTPQQFVNALQADLLDIIGRTYSSYVAPVVPVSQYRSTSSENTMYLGMFEPSATPMWSGNLKKYGIVSTATTTLSLGEVVDENGNPAIAPNSSTIVPTAESYWSTSPDGANVEAGGAGGVLQALGTNLNSRNIYTYLGTNTDLTTSSNAFSTSNTLITPALLGVSTTTAVQNIINFAYGWDAYNWNNGPGNPRQWILGAIIHSKPAVIHYGNQDVIYVGANDGMLHAFDNATGNELWAFIPPDLLPNLQNFGNGLSSLQIFVDGSPTAYVTSTYNSNGSVNSVTQAILVFGERRGGNTYTALDVTNPSDPKFLWSISPTQIRYQTTTTASTAYGEMGQSWSTPILGKIKNGSGTKWVVFIGGGYDATHEDTTPAGRDTCGRAVYVVDILTGNQIWKYSVSNNANMTYCIPSDITAISSNGDGFIERLYVGDVGGQIWRFDLCSSTTGTCVPDMSNTANWTGKPIFIAGSTGTPGNQKIFYPPDVTFETNKGLGTYDMLFFGTGDREKPNDTSVVNNLYAIKDYDNDTNPPTPLPLTVNNLVNVTSDVLQSSTATPAQKSAVLASLMSQSGWYITLNQSAGENPNPGEKCDAAATVLSGVAYYTTFAPTPVTTQSVCTINTGSGNYYALQYQTGNAMFDLNTDGTITVSDRSEGVGAGIPSGIVIAVINGTLTAYGGVAGGVFSPQLNNTNSIVPLDWRIVF